MTESPKSSASTSSATSATGPSLGETVCGGNSGAEAQTGTSGEQESTAGSASPTKSPTDGSADVPQRIQLSRTKGWRMPPNTVKVDRSTRFGNPTVCTPHNCSLAPCGCCGAGERCCVTVFREYVESGLEGRPSSTGSLAIALDAQAGYPRRTRLVDGLPALRGKNLACWCKPGAPCHADVLLELANS